MPDPKLSEFIRHRLPPPFVWPSTPILRRGAIMYIRALRRLITAAMGRKRIAPIYKRIWI
jgi:hypothetical protein